MSHWETVSLGELAKSIDYGVTASATHQPVGPKFLRITDIQNGSVNWDAVPWCECSIRSASEAQLQRGDIVFARTGATTGKSFLISECPSEAVFASYLIRVRLSDAANPRFVSHFFQTFGYWAQITKSARGVAQPGVNATTLKSLRIPLPPVSTQQRIANVLDKAEALLAKRRAALAKLDTLAHAIFLDMFGFGDSSSNPRGWPVASLLEILALPLRNGLSPSHGGKVTAQVLTLSAITGAGFNAEACKTAQFQAPPPPEQSVREDDFLICRGNGNPRLVGKGYFPPHRMPSVTFPDTIIAARIARDRIEPRFLQHVWNSTAVRRQIESVARTTNGTYKVNQSMLEAITFVLPPRSLQHKYAERVAGVDALKNWHRRSLGDLDALFASLQHRAFRGEL